MGSFVDISEVRYNQNLTNNFQITINFVLKNGIFGFEILSTIELKTFKLHKDI